MEDYEPAREVLQAMEERVDRERWEEQEERLREWGE